ncbi:DMT family transporter [Noviherbaspirillum pedocola]|uniref:DMT family transporter n=1 Tax=Noviherbaspirillum pedocola TaxID=2801341 RepID=A0A934W9J5_9BURK|nr:DMT family transporter [Noviherbaspirillum pedocola]MBK4737154.1 DMT family transporter [Noviherbaspirillum pedocola]
MRGPGATAQTRAARLAPMALLASGLVWGLCWLPLKGFAQQGLTGNLIGATAYALVALAALPVLWRERHAWRGEGILLAAIGLSFGSANIAFTHALMAGDVVRAMLLFYLLPAWGALGGKLFLNERIGARRLLAVALSLLGVVIIMGGAQVLDGAFSTADGAALAAGFCYAAGGIANRRARRIPVASRTMVTFIGCAGVATIGLLLFPAALPATGLSTWCLLILFAFLWLLGGTLLTTYGVTHIEASRAAVLQVVELLVAVVSALLLGGGSLGMKDWIGGGMIITATLLEATSANSEGNSA